MENGREQILDELEAELSSVRMKLVHIEEIVAKLKTMETDSVSKATEASEKPSEISSAPRMTVEVDEASEMSLEAAVASDITSEVVENPEMPSKVAVPKQESLAEIWNDQTEDAESADAGSVDSDGDVMDKIGPKFWLTDIAGVPVKDLRSAVSMNDKILFINTLFDEDHSLYQEVVQTLNGMESFSDAVNYLIPKFKNWNLDSDVVYRFMMAVRRRLK